MRPRLAHLGRFLALCLTQAPQHVDAVDLVFTPGPGTDNVTRVNDSQRQKACLHEDMDLTYENIVKLNVTVDNILWAMKNYKKYSDGGNYTLFEVIGRQQFGVPNFDCSINNTGCVELPTCLEIASFMKLNDTEKVPEVERKQLAQRYLLSRIIHNQYLYYASIIDALEDAKGDLTALAGKIVKDFTTQHDIARANKCEKMRAARNALINALLMAITTAIFVAGSLGTAGLGTPAFAEVLAFSAEADILADAASEAGVSFWEWEDGLFRAATVIPKLKEIAKKAPITTIPSLVSLAPQTSQIFGSSLGYGLHQEGIPGAYRASPNFLPTQLDNDDCDGDFDDLNAETENSMKLFIINMVEELRNMVQKESDDFAKGGFAFAQGLQNSFWAIPLKNGTILRETAHQSIKENVEDFLIGRSLTSSLCSAQCSNTNETYANFLCSAESRTGGWREKHATYPYPDATWEQVHSKANGSDHDMATFCPPELPGTVCHYFCLEQIEKHMKPVFSKNLNHTQNTPWNRDVHKLLSEAVTAHVNGSDYYLGLNDTLSEGRNLTGMRIPVCEGRGAFGLHNPPKEDMWPTQFSFTCGDKGGDWKANGTERYVNELGIGRTVPYFHDGSLDKFYDDYLVEKIESDHKSYGYGPVTGFLTFCRTQMEISEWPYKAKPSKGRTHSEPICDALASLVDDMTELEGNMAFCNSPLMQHYLKEQMQRAQDSRKPFKLPTDRNHKIHYCEDFTNQYRKESEDYIAKSKEWHKQQQTAIYPAPFRWEPAPGLRTEMVIPEL